MTTTCETILAPAEYQSLSGLQGTCCVVFDILRATSTMVTALGKGAVGIVPVCEIEEHSDWENPIYCFETLSDDFKVK